MKIFKDIKEVSFEVNTALTVGTFDGVHAAHKRIIDELLYISKENNLRSLIVTFDPHPQEVLKNKFPEIKLLSTTEEKLKLFEESGVENLLLINFTKEFSNTPAEDFYKDWIIDGIGIKELIIGYDHLFGKNREGDFTMLNELANEFDFNVKRVEEIDIDGTAVSSTRIRNLLSVGEIVTANRLLQYEYGFDDVVVEGDKVGRSIGFPTINLKPVSDSKIIPNDGIYCVRVLHQDKNFYGMMYIGKRPTLSKGEVNALEVNIFDFEENIYGEVVRIEFLKKLRSDVRFNSKEELIKQIERDKNNTKEFLINNQLIKK